MHPWPPAAPLIAPLAPADQRPIRPSRRQRRGRVTRSRAPRDLQQQVTFAHVPVIPTAIGIITNISQEPSTSGRTVEAGVEEREEERFDHRAATLALAERSALLADSDSSGYSPSPDREMPRQPISLLDELNLPFPPSRGGASRAPHAPANPPPETISAPSREQRDKRPLEGLLDTQPPLQRRRTGESSSSRPEPGSPPLVQPWAPILARPDGTPLTAIDKVTSVDVAYGVARAAMLPLDLEREKGCSYDALMKSIFQSSAGV